MPFFLLALYNDLGLKAMKFEEQQYVTKKV